MPFPLLAVDVSSGLPEIDSPGHSQSSPPGLRAAILIVILIGCPHPIVRQFGKRRQCCLGGWIGRPACGDRRIKPGEHRGSPLFRRYTVTRLSMVEQLISEMDRLDPVLGMRLICRRCAPRVRAWPRLHLLAGK
jgi:hypothetical protein